MERIQKNSGEGREGRTARCRSVVYINDDSSIEIWWSSTEKWWTWQLVTETRYPGQRLDPSIDPWIYESTRQWWSLRRLDPSIDPWIYEYQAVMKLAMQVLMKLQNDESLLKMLNFVFKMKRFASSGYRGQQALYTCNSPLIFTVFYSFSLFSDYVSLFSDYFATDLGVLWRVHTEVPHFVNRGNRCSPSTHCIINASFSSQK